MGHFAYLINTEISTNTTTTEALDGGQHISLEGGRGVCPLPWICCFRTNDLAPYTLVAENGAKFDIQIPVTSVEQAVENIKQSLPRYERLVGDTSLAREYWQHAVDGIKVLPYRFITLNIADFILLDPGNAEAFVNGFSVQGDALSGSDDLFEYCKGIRPRSLAEFNGRPPEKHERDADYEQSIHNSSVLFSPRYLTEADPALTFARLFNQQLQNAESGIPGCMFQVGQFYLHGRGTTKNVEEGIRWCTRAAEEGWGESARFLAYLYGNGGLGVRKNKEKATYWKAVVEMGSKA